MLRVCRQWKHSTVWETIKFSRDPRTKSTSFCIFVAAIALNKVDIYVLATDSN